MARELVDRMTGKWDPAKYTDEYRHALLDLIEKKIKLGGKTPPGETPSKRPSTNVIDLVSVLQESLQHSSKKKTAKPASKKKAYKKAA
jgi:DNA end-binding protein Ku